MTNILFLDADVAVDCFLSECVASLKHIASKVPFLKIVVFCKCKAALQGILKALLDQKLELPKDIMFEEVLDASGTAIADFIQKNKEKVGLGAFVIVASDSMPLKKMFPNNVVDCMTETGARFEINKAEEAIWILSGFSRQKDNIKHFVISDTHFYHENIIKYCNRPFASVDEMNSELVCRWNSVVEQQDIVWHLGDFCFGKKENVLDIFPKLNGKINLVVGNHDHHKISFYYDVGFHRVYDRPVVVQNFFILSHAPLEWVSNNGPYANIYGHVHDSVRYKTATSRSYCACVERQNYKPMLWNDIISLMKNEEEKENGKIKSKQLK